MKQKNRTPGKMAEKLPEYARKDRVNALPNREKDEEQGLFKKDTESDMWKDWKEIVTGIPYHRRKKEDMYEED